MRKLNKPPDHLRLQNDRITTPNGDWRGWDSNTHDCKRFKSDFASWASREQHSRCAYCSLPIGDAARRTSTLDHFVPKGGTSSGSAFARWTFEPLNLILACNVCNSGLKRAKNPLTSPHELDYARCTFDMIHPYLDDPGLHLIGGYRGAGKPRVIRCLTAKGRETARVFKLTDPGLFLTWLDDYRAGRRRRAIEALSSPLKALFAQARAEASGETVI
jgi:hypothetical protein